MTEERWLLIGTDARFKKLAVQLSKPHRTVLYKYSDEWNDELLKLSTKLQPNRIVLPIHPLKWTADMKSFLQVAEQATLFVGRTTADFKQQLSTAKTISYLQDEQFIWQNAKLTAEGMLRAFYDHEQKSMDKQQIVITGFGRVAKMTAALFRELGATIHVLARSETQIYEAEAYGYKASFLAPDAFEGELHYVINTVPVKWLTTAFSDKLSSATTLFELASAPGCLSFEEQPDFDYIQLPGLPGKYFPQDAAELLIQTIELYNEKLKEEHHA
ncbi:dipicolinate synthase [Viridibacillus sp. YIM B01967]|uniref:Dipicolinate synthase n=1 Tax=Viridibacillus soli TaxID=2798301 RepID=A0ABS1H5A6_9BACL|nr:dipicolinate synthase [Viridibacillus soli]MBK3494337.1 dipicolinate synthase [Viridibacillus soli]